MAVEKIQKRKIMAALRSIWNRRVANILNKPAIPCVVLVSGSVHWLWTVFLSYKGGEAMAAKTASAEQMRFYHELGKQIRKVRELRGLSQKDMAVYLRITNQQYQKYEAGNNRMGVWFLYKISQFLDVSFAKIVFPENPNNIIRMVSHIEIKEHIDFLSKYIRNMAHELLD
ncbi:MAG: helix-turn-helix transcriptional regulator [Alphaproteobacteria bacterium]|nr:helix-turn-helix transcriptional regulator [Alphaproteobacteria bacterium]